HLNLSNVLMKFGDLEGAKKVITKSLSLEPERSEAHFILGHILEQSGELKKAKEHYRTALSLNAEYLPANVNLGRVLRELGEFDEAISLYINANSTGVDSPEIQLNLGNILQHVGRLEEADKAFRNAITLEPKFPEAHYNLGNTLQDMGCLNEAWVSFQKALDINPKFFIAFSNMYLSIPALCHDILTKQTEISFIEELIDALPTPPEPDILRLRLRSLTGGDTEEAWNNVAGNMPTIQSETILNDNSITPPSIIRSEHSSQRKMVALLHFGRSGSGYLHSLLDDHPNISTLPGVYMSGFFGREVWDRISRKGFQEIPERFSSLYKVLFDARNPEKIPPADISDTYNNKSVGEKEGFVKMGPNQDTPLTLDRGQFLENLGEVINGLEGEDLGDAINGSIVF
ncbi:MAG TPA: tetratricopeptide repeat protein, partial [Rhodospirillales bacterium]|nr:tetratricopeptide repeat protein [Rhodospirillales bacterium]